MKLQQMMLRGYNIITTNEASDTDNNTDNNDENENENDKINSETMMIDTAGIVSNNTNNNLNNRIGTTTTAFCYDESHNNALYNMPLLLSPKEERRSAISVTTTAKGSGGRTPCCHYSPDADLASSYNSRNGPPHRISFTTSDDENNSCGELSSRKVRFNLEPTTAPPMQQQLLTSPLTKDRREELWYQKDELAAIKQEVKETLSAQREQQKRQQRDENAAAAMGGNNNKGDRETETAVVFPDNNDDDAIGLERFSPQRAHWKRSAIRYVLTAQNYLRKSDGVGVVGVGGGDYRNATNEIKEDYVRRISLRCTGWARQTAREQAFRDYCAAYDLDPARVSSSLRRRRRKRDSINGGGSRSRSSKRRHEAIAAAADPIDVLEPAENKRARMQTNGF